MGTIAQMRRLATAALWALPLIALFCLYSAFHFHTIQVISTPEQLPRMQYNRNCWLGFFAITAMLWLLVHHLRKRLQ